MADFTSGQLLVFRREYAGDLAIETPGSQEYLSYFNLARHANWRSDAVINSLKARVERDYADELDSIESMYATADQAGQLLDATMRLVRAEYREMQINDSGFMETIADSAVRAQLIKAWSVQIQSDRHFMRSRAGAPFSAVRLERG
jgi:hypothetical protein